MKYAVLIVLLMTMLCAPPSHADHPLAGVEATADDSRVSLTSSKEVISAGDKVRLEFSLKDKAGRPLPNLAISHDRILHVMIISSDFSVFSHIHPEDFGPISEQMKKDARFGVEYAFPKAGRYLVALDYAAGERAYSKRLFIPVTGTDALGSIEKNIDRTKKYGAYSVSLKTDADPVVPGKPVKLTYEIMHDNKPVTDIESYLSAAMHIAIVHADLDNFVHAHGDTPGMNEHAGHAGHGAHPMGHIHGVAQKNYGPLIEAQAVFPIKGLYQIFGEFMHRGKVIVTRFMIEVR